MDCANSKVHKFESAWPTHEYLEEYKNQFLNPHTQIQDVLCKQFGENPFNYYVDT
jgi:hypothetical protein